MSFGWDWKWPDLANDKPPSQSFWPSLVVTCDDITNKKVICFVWGTCRRPSFWICMTEGRKKKSPPLKQRLYFVQSNQCSLIRNLLQTSVGVLWMASHSKSQKLPHNYYSVTITSRAAPPTPMIEEGGTKKLMDTRYSYCILPYPIRSST